MSGRLIQFHFHEWHLPLNEIQWKILQYCFILETGFLMHNKKGPWHETKGDFGGAELRGPSEPPYLQEEMPSVNKGPFVKNEKTEEALFWRRLGVWGRGRLPLGVCSLTLLVKEWLSGKGRD